jgi:hypothetical protein
MARARALRGMVVDARFQAQHRSAAGWFPEQAARGAAATRRGRDGDRIEASHRAARAPQHDGRAQQPGRLGKAALVLSVEATF